MAKAERSYQRWRRRNRLYLSDGRRKRRYIVRPNAETDERREAGRQGNDDSFSTAGIWRGSESWGQPFRGSGPSRALPRPSRTGRTAGFDRIRQSKWRKGINTVCSSVQLLEHSRWSIGLRLLLIAKPSVGAEGAGAIVIRRSFTRGFASRNSAVLPQYLGIALVRRLHTPNSKRGSPLSKRPTGC